MVFILIVAVLILSQNYPQLHAAPSVEACPPDSVLSEDSCKCDPESCVKPPCLSVLTLSVNGSDLPGSCCPIYECVDCDNATLIDGKCPCAPGAVLDKNQCKCVDEEKHLVEGECVCDPLQCRLPLLCDHKSVPITVEEGCCKKTICQPCPPDSESTHQDSDLIDDHCVCLPCRNDCGNNRTIVVKKHGTGLPGNCCDLYECKKLEEIKGCHVDDVMYENGEEWLSPDGRQRCKCQNGLSLCSNTEEKSRSCFSNNKIYKHLEQWTKEDGCTYCTCLDGEEKCISHFCEAKESQIQKNNSQPCIKEEPNAKRSECKPLANCNKTCENGFKMNKKGCEICKCVYLKYTEEILDRYNITMKELLMIIKDYTKQRAATTITTFGTPLLDSVSNEAPIVTMKNARLMEDTEMASTTTEPSVVPTDTGYWNIALPILALLSLGCVAFIIAVAMCIYKSRRKSSMDLSHCHYETVNNNNTIKKTELL